MNDFKSRFCIGMAVLLAAGPAVGQSSGGSSGGKSTVTYTNTANGPELTIGSPPTAATVPNSNDNYYDDGLKWSVDIEAWSNPFTTPTADLCIPANTRLMGRGTAPVTTVTVPQSTVDAAKTQATAPVNGKAATGTASVTAATAPTKYVLVELNPTPYLFGLVTGPQHAIKFDAQHDVEIPQKNAAGNIAWTSTGAPCKALPSTPASPAAINPGQSFYVSYDDLQNVDYRSGWDYGALIVPFKAQMSSKKAISGSASLGGYLGYRMPFQNLGVALSPIIFAGASSISTSVTNGGSATSQSTTSQTTTSQTLAALTYGGGVVAQIKDSSFQVGLILGFDHVDSVQPYTYNDKPWLSLEIGYSFAQ